MSDIELARGELAAALAQRSSSDDAIIMDHIQRAHDLLKREIEERRQPFDKAKIAAARRACERFYMP